MMMMKKMTMLGNLKQKFNHHLVIYMVVVLLQIQVLKDLNKMSRRNSVISLVTMMMMNDSIIDEYVCITKESDQITKF